MPRPGPRPYECVRRAWHSDRHGSIRGSTIQQIFRVAHESHGAATKKNREWLQKLPAVVFKAEEIIYSKANSEAEYMNIETLRDRIDDAIDTIIRRDESTENVQCLPPCIEAALHLGCVQVRASRSQRDSNPRIYLTPRAQQPEEGRPPLVPVHAKTQPKQTKPDNRNTTHLLLSEPNNTKVSASSSSPNNLLDLGSVYPLYYGTHYPPPHEPRTVLLGTPIRPFLPEPVEIGPFSHGSAETAPLECDLSLRLGAVMEEGIESTKFHQQLNKEFCFFPEKGSEDEDIQRGVKRRKALVTSHEEEDARFSLQPELRPG